MEKIKVYTMQENRDLIPMVEPYIEPFENELAKKLTAQIGGGKYKFKVSATVTVILEE